MKLVDLTHLNWVTTHNGGASYGCYYKATSIENGIKYYYKCSNFYTNNMYFGDESINEVICSRLFRILGIDCARYSLMYALVRINGAVYKTYVCKSVNYFAGYDSRITLENKRAMHPDKKLDEVINMLGIQNQVKQMIIADYITIQRDRHGGNIELLIKDNKYVMAPLFDNGLSFLAPYPSQSGISLEIIKNFDVLEDRPVNNYIGTRSLYQNLKYIDKPIRLNKLTKEDKRKIFYGLSGALPKEYINKIWQIITYRYMLLKQKGFIVDA